MPSNHAYQLQNEAYLREINLNNLYLDIEVKKSAMEKNKILAREITEFIETIKNELKIIKNKLILHYHKILNEGLDTRSEGLIWIIKAIWNLGSNVIISNIPSYLDEISIDFLFSLAHKEYALQKMRNDIEEVRSKLRNKLNQLKTCNFKGKGFNSTFKTDLKVILYNENIFF